MTGAVMKINDQRDNVCKILLAMQLVRLMRDVSSITKSLISFRGYPHHLWGSSSLNLIKRIPLENDKKQYAGTDQDSVALILYM